MKVDMMFSVDGLCISAGLKYGANLWPEEWYIDCGEHLANEVADDDGMPPPYIKLDAGINEPRALSWAEERALREDLRLSIDPVCSVPGRPAILYRLAPDFRSIWGSADLEPPYPKMTVREWQAQYQQQPRTPVHRWNRAHNRCRECGATDEQVMAGDIAADICPGSPDK